MANGKIKKPVIKPNPKRVRFCFDHLQPDHQKFPITECPKEFFEGLLKAILHFGTWTIDHFMDMENDQNRHLITFKETTEHEGFRTIDPSDEELWTDTPWQFAIPGVR